MATQVTVAPGDTLSGIGARYGLSYSQSVNGGVTGYRSGSPNLIFPGETLTINTPTPAGTTPTTAPPVAPTNPSQVQGALDAAHDNTLSNASGVPPVRSSAAIFQDLSTQATPKDANGNPIAAPVAPNLVDTYGNLRQSNGVNALEDTVTSLNGQIKAIQDSLLAQKYTEDGKPVAQDVINGRLTEEQQQANEKIAVLNTQKQTAVDQLNYAYNNIKTIMDLTDKDYANASATYDKQFQQNLSLINATAAEQGREQNARQQAIDTARANLQVYVNNIKDGGLSLGNLSSDQQLALNKMEVAAGFYPGFLQSIKADPKASIMATSTLPNGQTQIIFKNPDGSVSVKQYGQVFAIPNNRTGGKAPAEGSAAATVKDAVDAANSVYGTLKPGESYFPKFIEQFGPSLSWAQLNKAYLDSKLGQAYGAPKEDPAKMRAYYNYVNGK